MFDISANSAIAVEMMLAQAPTPPAVIAPPQKSQNWMGGDEFTLRNFKQYMDVYGPKGLKARGMYEYRPEGPLGMPTLVMNLPVDYYVESFKPSVYEEGKGLPQSVGLARSACLFLDIEAKQAGAWGPECKIGKFITLPEGRLDEKGGPKARPGDYMYTPPRIGTDTLRFILENGAGRQVDVTINLNASSYQGGALDIENPMLAISRRTGTGTVTFQLLR